MFNYLCAFLSILLCLLHGDNLPTIEVHHSGHLAINDLKFLLIREYGMDVISEKFF